jgi:hypothetical protein
LVVIRRRGWLAVTGCKPIHLATSNADFLVLDLSDAPFWDAHCNSTHAFRPIAAGMPEGTTEDNLVTALLSNAAVLIGIQSSPVTSTEQEYHEREGTFSRKCPAESASNSWKVSACFN